MTEDFIDISCEEWREYTWSDGFKVRVEAPTRLKVSANGHRVEDASRQGHYVPLGWRHLCWQARDGASVFVA